MEKLIEGSGGGDDRMVERAFRMARKCEGMRNPGSSTEFQPTSKDIPTLAGLGGRISEQYRNLYYFFKASSVGCFGKNKAGMIEQVERCISVDSTDWLRVRNSISNLWDAFFGGSSVGREWPGFVILMPGGYVTTNHSFSMQGEKTRIPKPEIVQAVTGSKVALVFGQLWERFDIPVDIREIPLRIPEGRQKRWTRPVVRRRVRYFTQPEGHRSAGETIFQLGRADPDDEHKLRNGHYYPNTEGRRVMGQDGLVCFTNGMSVLVLARLVPNPSDFRATIHQMSISISADFDSIMDINCMNRSFGQFVKHYPGVGELIRASLLA